MSVSLRTGALTFVVCTALSSTAQAVDFEVTGDVAAQGYDVVSPWGDVVLGRRRLYATLGLAAYNLQGDAKPFDPVYNLVVRMRVDPDFGVDSAEYNFDQANQIRYVPGLPLVPVDMMYGYVEGKNIADGWFGFRVGRQYVTDVLGWWSFDGGMVSLTTPFYLKAEVYGGLEQRGGLPLSTSRFESQGVWRGRDGGLTDAGTRTNYPSYQFAAMAPAFGVALESTGFNYLHGRFDYRRVYNTGEAFTNQYPAPADGGFEKVDGLRVSSDRIGYALTGFLPELGSVRGGFAYDLYNALISRGFGGIDVYPHHKVTVGADYEYFIPTFDADSIFNWFTHNPSHTATGRVALGPFEGFDMSLSGGARLWITDGDPESYALDQCTYMLTGQVGGNPDPVALQRCIQYGIEPGVGGIDPATGAPQPSGRDAEYSRLDEARTTVIAPDLLGNLGARYTWGNGMVGLDSMVQTGFGDVATNRGRRVGGALRAKQALAGGMFWLGGRVSVYDWTDPSRDDRDATSFGYVVAPEYRPADLARIRVEWEHNMNRLVGQRFRLLGLVTFRLGFTP
ncbi:MAG TPA: hypothetical protein ENK57_09275 [Polyangiaceae bacterium]|nr:hypothetical protein [Polyangiaceae bacterium]